MTFWASDDKWRYDVFEPDVDPEEFGNQARFVAMWQNKRRDGLLPAWRDFDPIADFVGYYGWVNVEDIISAKPYNARFRLFGTQASLAYGNDFTGREIRDTPGDFFTEIEYRLSEKIIEERIIARSLGPVRGYDHDFITVSILEFPLADDGRTVDRILVLTTEV